MFIKPASTLSCNDLAGQARLGVGVPRLLTPVPTLGGNARRLRPRPWHHDRSWSGGELVDRGGGRDPGGGGNPGDLVLVECTGP